MKIAVVQSLPEFDVSADPLALIQGNLSVIHQLLLDELCPQDNTAAGSVGVNLIVAPEMAATGYCFSSREQVLPFARLHSLSIDWALAVAKEFNAFVQIGFPRLDDDSLYNSTVMAFPNGSQFVYDKHFLYCQDEHWATPGESFKVTELPDPLSCK
ncbi:MAG: hypothetical protein SGCHY_005264, partial [Lobulomycetales sp.]